MKRTSLNERDRADLVAYLDGELTGESLRTIEAKLALDPAFRAEADSYKRTWDLLDYLPKKEPSPEFAARTMSRLVPVKDLTPAAASAWPRLVFLVVCWAFLFVGFALGSYLAIRFFSAREPGDRELARDLHVIEHKRLFDAVDDIEFLRKLDAPELFGDGSP